MSRPSSLICLLPFILIQTGLSSAPQLDEGLTTYHKVLKDNREFRRHVGLFKPVESDGTFEGESVAFWEVHGAKLEFLAVMVLFILVIIVTFRVTKLKKSLNQNRQEVKKVAEKMERIIDQSDKLVFVTWKDQSEGIVFLQNPAYKSSYVKTDLSKGQKVQNDLTKLTEEVEKAKIDVESMKSKEELYRIEITKLKKTFESAKVKRLDPVASLGYAENVLREYN